MRRSFRSRGLTDSLTPNEEIKEPYVLEFLGLKDEYSESELEDALLGKLQVFLLELGGDFAFVGRQHRLRVGNEWYRVDLLFFHRRLRCLVIIDLKLGKLSHADAHETHFRQGHGLTSDASHHSETPRARRNEGPRLSCSLSSHRGRSRVWLAAGPVSCTRACGGA